MVATEITEEFRTLIKMTQPEVVVFFTSKFLLKLTSDNDQILTDRVSEERNMSK